MEQTEETKPTPPEKQIKEHLFLNGPSIARFPRMGADIVRHGDGIAHYTGKYLGKNPEIVYGNPGDYLVTWNDGSKEILSEKTFRKLTELETQVIVEHKEPEVKENITRENAPVKPIENNKIGEENGEHSGSESSNPTTTAESVLGGTTEESSNQRTEIPGDLFGSQEGTTSADQSQGGFEGRAGEENEGTEESDSNSSESGKRGRGRPRVNKSETVGDSSSSTSEQ